MPAFSTLSASVCCDQESRFFEPRAHAVGDVDDRLDAFEFERERERSGVEPIGGQRLVGRVDLPQTGQRFDFGQRVFGGQRERAALAIDIERQGRVHGDADCALGAAFNRLFGIEREVVGLLDRLDELEAENLAIAFHGRVPVADLLADETGERLGGWQRQREPRGVALDDVVVEPGGVFDDGGRDVRAEGRVHGEQRFARNFGDFAETGPAQCDRRVRAEIPLHARHAVGLGGLEQGAVEQLHLHADAPGLGGHGGNRRRRAGERNLVPRLGALDFGDQLERE